MTSKNFSDKRRKQKEVMKKNSQECAWRWSINCSHSLAAQEIWSFHLPWTLEVFHPQPPIFFSQSHTETSSRVLIHHFFLVPGSRIWLVLPAGLCETNLFSPMMMWCEGEQLQNRVICFTTYTKKEGISKRFLVVGTVVIIPGDGDESAVIAGRSLTFGGDRLLFLKASFHKRSKTFRITFWMKLINQSQDQTFILKRNNAHTRRDPR